MNNIALKAILKEHNVKNLEELRNLILNGTLKRKDFTKIKGVSVYTYNTLLDMLDLREETFVLPKISCPTFTMSVHFYKHPLT